MDSEGSDEKILHSGHIANEEGDEYQLPPAWAEALRADYRQRLTDWRAAGCQGHAPALHLARSEAIRRKCNIGLPDEGNPPSEAAEIVRRTAPSRSASDRRPR